MSSGIRITPPPYAEGFYEVRAPYTDIVVYDQIYKCTALRTFSELAARSVDVLTLIYKKYNLTEADYQSDLKNNAIIVTLENQTDPTQDDIYIPDTYIASYPNMDIAEYNRVIVSIDLGGLPANIDIGYLNTIVKQGALEILGVDDCAVNVHKGPSTGTIAMSEHNKLLAERVANKRANPTLSAQLDASEKENRELVDVNKKLVEYIIALEAKLNE